MTKRIEKIVRIHMHRAMGVERCPVCRRDFRKGYVVDGKCPVCRLEAEREASKESARVT